MKVQIKVRPSGAYNGEEWPEEGETIDLPDHIAESMVTSGHVIKPNTVEAKEDRAAAEAKAKAEKAAADAQTKADKAAAAARAKAEKAAAEAEKTAAAERAKVEAATASTAKVETATKKTTPTKR